MGEQTALFFTAYVCFISSLTYKLEEKFCVSLYMKASFTCRNLRHYKIFCSAPSFRRRLVCVHKQQIFLEKKTSQFLPSFLKMFSVVHLLSFNMVFHNVSIRKKEEITEDGILLVFFLIIICFFSIKHPLTA